MKYAVGVIGIAGTILTVILTRQQIRQQDNTNRLIEDTRNLTSQKDSLLKVVEGLQTLKSSEQVEPIKKDSTQ